MDLKLKNKSALVLASSQGLGKAVAKQLIAEGAKVIISSSNAQNLNQCAEEIKPFGQLCCDLTNPQQVDQLLRKSIQLLDGIDILVTNAGGPPPGTFHTISDAQWHESFQSLFMSVVQSVRAVVPAMSKQGWGRIIMLTSTAGKEPLHNLTISNGLRAGVHGLMNSLSRELGPDGITVNAVLTGFTKTERLNYLSPEQLKAFEEAIPVKRMAIPKEIGELVSFLASGSAGYINGQAIGFDGGSMQGI